ncbi:predicted protein [Sclerotinia sclerotiorum 1980 UF-70]|uniref:Uncharacterized protein n=2 Tax=Sclerotinia sclerotiorum (strain ATCC 18683 / 1980 / Ss-1) TaxID=665079 RepID=A7EHX7_SCLS1|nr:predicted protein [Sclerotinia sclerotiorum 1980 UF-70]APA11509.1 hypothetical protein sscle_08g062790 [Sclerotinia sclerotiorum 1980 UF-70]EDO02443.1 predicted protein [Sclerotinia sclerotiorum 1980 UF-70]
MPRQIDPIVVVHGLGATPMTTWTKARKPQEHIDRNTESGIAPPSVPTNKSEDRVNWLSDPTMLPADITNARIMAVNDMAYYSITTNSISFPILRMEIGENFLVSSPIFVIIHIKN